MHLNSFPASSPAGRHRDIDSPAIVGSNAPEPRRAPVTQYGAGPARQNSSNEDTAPIELAVTNRVDPRMDQVQAPTRKSVLDRPKSQAEGEQLPESDHTMLAFREFRDPPVT
jgi:hypothetical protein